MFETFGLEHPPSWLLGYLRLARVLMWVFALVRLFCASRGVLTLMAANGR